MNDKLYDQDFFSWTQEQAELLRRAEAMRLNAPPELDWANLAEEIEDLGKSQQRELYSRYKILILHLLKWRFQPGMRTSGWRRSMRDQRDEIRQLLDQSPGLKVVRQNHFARAYPKSRLDAADETGLPVTTFPEDCPFSIEEVEDEAFWPGAAELVERPAP